MAHLCVDRKFAEDMILRGKQPVCTVCRHEACPFCETWCDVMMRNIYCPKCEAIVGEVGDEKHGDMVSCPCGHKWPLRLPGLGHDDDDIGVDACCDGQCTYAEAI